MKRTTKILSVLLAAVLLMSVLNVGTLAASYTPISVGQVITASVDKNYGKLALEFIPEESGAYAFYSMGYSDTCGYIFDSKMNLICENDDYTDLNFYAVCNMTAGEKYYLRSELYSNDGYGEYSVSIEKVQPAEEIFIFHGGETTGYVDNFFYLECMSEPEEAYAGETYWESDNEDVAYVTYSEGSYCELYLAGVGTANISVTTSEGLSDTVEITVIEIPKIKIDDFQYLTFGVIGGTRYFTFTPESDGEYAFYTDGALMPAISIYDSDYNYVSVNEKYKDSGDITLRAELSSKETYTIEISTFLESPDFWFGVVECPAPDGVKILSTDMSEGSYKGYRALTVELYAVFTPDIALTEACTWSSSNEDVAMVFETRDGCELMFVDVGTAEITVTTESGLSDTIIVECLPIEEIKLNEEVQVINAVEGVVYKFVPDHKGVYAFVSEGGAYAIGLIASNIWQILDISLGLDSDFSVQAEMFTGDECYVATVGTGNYTVKVVECKRAESVSLSSGTDFYGYVGESLFVDAVFNGENAIIEKSEFNINNIDKSVLDAYIYGDGGCELYFENAGTAEITVKSESGLTATCTFHIKDIEAEELILNEEKTVTLDKYANSYFTFIPEEDGVYSFISTGDLDTYVSVMDWELYEYDYDEDSGVNSNFCLRLDMVAGEEYLFKTSCYEPYADGDTYGVKIIKSPTASEMIIVEEGTVEADVGSIITFTPEFLPAGALREEVYFRVSDRSVIEVMLEDEYSCTVIVNGNGVATLEAYTDSGLYSEVTVVAGKALMPGDANNDGEVNSLDSYQVKSYIIGLVDTINVLNADVNKDGQINSIDSNFVKRIIIGKEF